MSFTFLDRSEMISNNCWLLISGVSTFGLMCSRLQIQFSQKTKKFLVLTFQIPKVWSTKTVIGFIIRNL